MQNPIHNSTQQQDHSPLLHEVSILLEKHYHLTGDLQLLAGEVDQNLLLKDSTGGKHLVKLSTIPPAEFDFQMSMMDHLQSSKLPFVTPMVVPSDSGNSIPFADGHLRVHTWVPGRMMDDVNPRSNKVLRLWGAVCGSISKALEGFDHPEAHRVYKWDPLQTLASRPLLTYIATTDRQSIATYFWEYYESKQSTISTLRKSVNHNDLHEHNVLCTPDRRHP